MKSLKIVFFGTPEFAKTCLQRIYESPHEIVGVVTVPDKLSGRGLKLNASAVKIFAEQNNLPLFQPEKLRDENFLQEMNNRGADVFVVVAFRMMPKMLYTIPPLGTFNLHASLLPDYRGAAPINFAIINGEEKTGVTTFFINEKIDEGHILLQRKTEIFPDETAGELHDRLMEIGADLIVETLDGLSENDIQEKPQPFVEQPKNAFKIFKDDTRIDWRKNSAEVHNFIRGMSPYPAAFTEILIGNSKKSLKIFAGKFEITDHQKTPGEIEISKDSLKFFTADGIYFPTEIQPEGKKRMDAKSFLNGIQDFSEIKSAN
ncbi:methionyl-tRNA formyltransferase [Cruoricaptor ignavus]|uniref:Methionyl-tRNA formyltransferase n=1 Tax=Cruoricaptor ignavus TaxID=1118202 RepID=A0A1M6A4S8_9FLAO|nr:methionyl-tRNA formyltransferase [Cruoricaptor ignavus]SHI31501.1 methionyl-tRNA formyltransferase [Cruoricaptor ignavus]